MNIFVINDVDSMVRGGNVEYIHELERHILLLEDVYGFGRFADDNAEYVKELREKIKTLKQEKTSPIADLLREKGENQ